MPEIDHIHLKVVLILTFGFALASFLGYLTHKIKLSPILGYLLAGYIIGPFSPGFVADLEIAEQLAEIGVMLMMFGVGLHFKWQDLIKVKNIAIPGAIGQTFAAVVISVFVFQLFGGNWQSGIMIGLAIGVASTVVLVRGLSDHHLLNTKEGHIAVGWLIVEDILTVAVLIFLPTLVALMKGNSISVQEIVFSMALLLIKFAVLAILMFTIGRQFVSYALFKIAQTRSQELFILTILAFIFVIATSSAIIFGTSIALGAFLSGMVIGQTDVRQQAFAYAAPMKDAFAVIFFLSVGMLFNPYAIGENFLLFLSILAIVLIIKPLSAFLIVIFLHYPKTIALTIAIALAQIGEFSFILAEESEKFNVFPEKGYDIIVACALVSIAINPLLFKLLDYLKKFMGEKESIALKNFKEVDQETLKALVVGFGVIGQGVVETLEDLGFRPLIIDRNIDLISKLMQENRKAVFGEASYPNFLKEAQIQSISLLVITIPDLTSTVSIIHYAKDLNPKAIIVARAKHFEDKQTLFDAGAKYVCCDDEEVKESICTIINQLNPILFST